MTIKFKEFDISIVTQDNKLVLIDVQSTNSSAEKRSFSTFITTKEYSELVRSLITYSINEKLEIDLNLISEFAGREIKIVGTQTEGTFGVVRTSGNPYNPRKDYKTEWIPFDIMATAQPEAKPKAEVIIYIPDEEVSLSDTEAITNAAGDFMEALGFELETEDEPVFGSFFKRLKFLFTRTIANEDLEQLYSKGKKALELKHVDLPTAEQTEKLSSAAESLVRSLDKFEEGVARLGAVLVLKKVVDGKPRIIIQQLSTEMIIILDKQPKLMYSLNTVYELLTGDVKTPLDGTEETAAIIT